MKCLKVSSRFDLPFNISKYRPECLISIKDINYKFPQVALDFQGPKLLLSFEDLLSANNRDTTAPNKYHILSLISFAICNRGKTFLVNCTAGISRSSAAAYIVETISDSQDPTRVLLKLLEKNPEIFPNERMLKIATKLTHVDFIKPFDALRHIMQERFFRRIDRGE